MGSGSSKRQVVASEKGETKKSSQSQTPKIDPVQKKNKQVSYKAQQNYDGLQPVNQIMNDSVLYKHQITKLQYLQSDKFQYAFMKGYEVARLLTHKGMSLFSSQAKQMQSMMKLSSCINEYVQQGYLLAYIPST